MKRVLLFFVSPLMALNAGAQSIFDTLTTAEKIYGLSTFWKEASYNFVFFDKANINWDSAYQTYIPKVLKTKNLYEYWQVLDRFASLLKDGHTSVWQQDYFWKDIGNVPLYRRRIDNRHFVTRLDERLANDIPPGTEIVAINGMTVDSFYRKNPYSPIKGTPFEYTFKLKNGSVFTKTIHSVAGKDTTVRYFPKSTLWTRFESKILDGNIYYIKINTFGDSTIPHLFRKLLPEIKKTKALILDIRENEGGNSDYARGVAMHLVSSNNIVESAWRTRVHRAANKAWASRIIYNSSAPEVLENQEYLKGNFWEYHPGDTFLIPKKTEKVKVPIIVLTGRQTVSAAEDFLIMLDGSKNITRIGQPTAGSSGQPLILEILPGKITARICAKRDTYPDGREFINIGIKPDILIKKTVEDYVENRDTELNAALQFIKEKQK
jgi:carboxyl-terminal processing protease